MKVFLYRSESGIAVGFPAEEVLAERDILEIAIKDVPAGVPFKIMDVSDLPTTPQEEWVFPDDFFNNGVGGKSSEFTD